MPKKAVNRQNKRTPRRPPIPNEIKAEVLRRCRRHCCMCFGLRKILEVKDGQIAHLDRDRANNRIENLAYLCLECHKHYDSKSNRVQALTEGELRHYRMQLFRALGHDQTSWTLTVTADRSEYEYVKKAVDKAFSDLRSINADASLNEAPLGLDRGR